jgi:anti-repressor protein
MNQIQIFEHPMFGELPIVMIKDKEYFGATESASILGYVNVHDALSKHCRKDGVAFCEVIDSLGRRQQKKFISEGNLYRLITRSKLSTAEPFEQWVFDEVLPSIRKHGAYLTPETLKQAIADPSFTIGILQALETERQETQQLKNQIQADLPYTNFGKVVSNSSGAISIGTFAKMMYDKHGIKIGRNKMFEWLRENGYLIKQGREYNNPKQVFIEQGLFDVKPTIVTRTEGDVEKLTTLITGKGQVKLAEILLKNLKVAI